VRHSEALYEDESFPERELAALVAAKVYYQLQEYNESMVFALGAGKLLDIHKAGEFEETILGKQAQTVQDRAQLQMLCLAFRRQILCVSGAQRLTCFFQRNASTRTSLCPFSTTHRPPSARQTMVPRSSAQRFPQARQVLPAPPLV